MRQIEYKTNGLIWLLPAFFCWIFTGGKFGGIIFPWLAVLFTLRATTYPRKKNKLCYLLIFVVIFIANEFRFYGLLSGQGILVNSLLFIVVALFQVLPFVINGLVAKRIKNSWMQILLFPAIWVLFELLISYSVAGTIISLGSSQYFATVLLQIASITGVFGISFLICFVSSFICYCWNNGFKRNRMIVFFSVIAVVLVFGCMRLTLNPVANDTIRVASITNFYSVSEFSGVDKNEYFQSAHCDEMINSIEKDVREASENHAKIAMWEEECFPILSSDQVRLESKASELAKKYNIALLLPMEIRQSGDKTLNTVSCFNEQGALCWRYEKNMLVPVVETSQYIEGDGIIRDITVGNTKFAVVICLDASNPGFVSQIDADVLLAPSWEWEDVAGFVGYGTAIRSVENGVSYVRNSYKGICVSTDNFCRQLGAHLNYVNNEGVLYTDVPIHGSWTFFNQFGDVFAWLCIIYVGICIIISIKSFINNRRKNVRN